jgi:hypothetical protein
MKISEILPGICLLAGVFFLSCDKENPVSHSDCKNSNLKSIGQSCDYGPDSSCVSYIYNDQDKKLKLTHINAGFNCCPGEIYCHIEIKNDTVFLTESEEKADCDCDCLYDIDIHISEIVKQKYYISIIEPYRNNQEKILFEIDLTQNETGLFCVERTLYPWGI